MVGRGGSQEGAQSSNPPRQRVLPEKTSCSDHALTAKGSLSISELWLRLSSSSLVQGVVLPAQRVTRG